MDLPKNRFKTALREGRHQLGIWSSIGGPNVPEMLAGAGFDWIVVDLEHSTTDVPEVLPTLQALAAYPSVSAVVRPAANDPVMIKRVMDFGAQTILLPYVQTPEEAASAVSATRYPPNGMRGVAGGTRASNFGRIKNYHSKADAEVCVIVQVETVSAMAQLEAIATTSGVDGVFIGPSDLAASMGYPGEPNHPKVCEAIIGAIGKLKSLGVPAGILSLNGEFARECIEQGTSFTAVATDFGLLTKAVDAKAAEFRG